MKCWLEVIKAYQEVDPTKSDPHLQQKIRQMKRLNFLWDCVDIFFKVIGILFILLGFFLLWRDLQGSIILVLFDCVTVYFGFKIAEGIDK